MKTPRELLLARHAAAGPRLDTIRARVVANLAGEESGPAARAWWSAIWEELFWSCRRAWLGVGVVWGLLLLLNLAAAARPDERRTVALLPTPETRRMLVEQMRLRAELIGGFPERPAVTQPRGTPRPQSNGRPRFLIC